MKILILPLILLITSCSSKKVVENIEHSSEPIVVAVIDCGIDSNHPYFQDKLIEVPSLVPNENNADNDGHGTHVSGIIAQALNNKINYKLVSIKVCSEKRFEYLRSFKINDPRISADESSLFLVQAIKDAIKTKAKIINISQVIHYNSPKLTEAFLLAQKAGILVVAASGNSDINLTMVKNYLAKLKQQGKEVDDKIGNYPCQLGLDNIICVGNYQPTSQGREVNSSYGTSIVHVWAMGTNVASACVGGRTDCIYTGSSMSSPKIAARAAQIWSTHLNLTNLEIKEKLFNSLPEDSKLKEFGISGKYLD